MRTVELRAEVDDGLGQFLHPAGMGPGRRAEARQINGDNVVGRCERRHHRRPNFAPAAQPVQQHERLPRTDPVVSQHVRSLLTACQHRATIPNVDYDVLVIGSGFGGSVTALRLTEKGYRVGVLEAGRRFEDDEFAKTSWRLRRYVWAPRLGCYGIQRMTLLRNTFVMSGAGVGGGSLVYANTLYEPPDPFYEDPQWAHITDWKAELAPYYDQAKRMLGVTLTPAMTPADRVLREVADEMGIGDTFRPTPVGVLFGAEPGEDVADPFFGGVGPARRTCTSCGECMTGCRHNAKNTTPKNYLYLAEQAGAQVHPLTTVTSVRSLDGGGYQVETVRANGTLRRGKKTYTADQVVFAAAALGTQKLLHKLKDNGTLPALSPRLGELTRSNSEEILGTVAKKRGTDFAQGIAITSSIHPEPNTHLEVCHYGKGQNALFMQTVPMVDGGAFRFVRFLLAIVLHPGVFLRSLNARHASERSVLLLFMQSLDN